MKIFDENDFNAANRGGIQIRARDFILNRNCDAWWRGREGVKKYVAFPTVSISQIGTGREGEGGCVEIPMLSTLHETRRDRRQLRLKLSQGKLLARGGELVMEK